MQAFCPLACEIFLDQGSNLCPLHWQAEAYPLFHLGSLSIFLREVVSSEHFYIKRSFYYEMMVIVHSFFLHDYLLTVLMSAKTKTYKVPGELILKRSQSESRVQGRRFQENGIATGFI